MKLTVKQRKFADEYIICGNATEAAINAGYSEKSAYSIGNENLKKPELQKYIEKRLQEIESEKIAQQDEVMRYLTSIMRGEETEQTLRSVGEFGQVIDDIEVSAKDRIKAAELIGKRYGMWTDKVQVNEPIEIQIVRKSDNASD